MFGLSRSVTLSLVGWLWADILLGLFVIFLAAASPPVKLTQPTGPSIDPTPISLDVAVDGSRLLGTDASLTTAEQTRFADVVKQQLLARSESRRVALVFAYGWHQDPVLGERLATTATRALTGGQFDGAVLKDLHDIHAGDPGTKVTLEIYVYR
jgi:hypothetical protein